MWCSITLLPTHDDADKKYYPDRQRITLPHQGQGRSAPIDSSKKLKDYVTTDRPQVIFKDLGPQVSYRSLFLFEYFGPLIIYPIFYFYPQVYTHFGLPKRTFVYPAQTYALYAWCFHYAKRELETLFVHRFSHATSPLANVYRNCIYYWAFAGFIGYSLNHPNYNPVGETQLYVGIVISIVSQLSNFYCHIILRNLRKSEGKHSHHIPHGFLFNSVTCANYTTEIMQWLGFNVATQTLAGYLFIASGTYIMTVWAVQKHSRLVKVIYKKKKTINHHPFLSIAWILSTCFIS